MLDRIYVFNPDYEKNEVDNRIIVIEPKEESVFILEEIEAAILKKMNGTNTLKDAIRELENDYNVTNIENDVVEFIDQLTEKGILIY